MIIRKSYLSYIFQGFKHNSFTTVLKYPFRYFGTFAGYKLGESISGPIQGTLCLTYNCNLHCEMCDLPLRHKNLEAKNESFNLDQYYKIIDDFAAIGTSGMAISGGEPMLHKDLYQIIKYIRKNEMMVQMTTNGWFITPDTAQELYQSGINVISISLDGATAQTHNKIRKNEQSFQKAIEAIKILNQVRTKNNASFKINISSTLGKNNYSEAIELVQLAKSLGADYIGFMPVHEIAPDLDNHDYSLNNESDLESLFKTVDQLIKIKKEDDFIETSVAYLKMFKSFYQNEKLPIPCLAGYTTLVVDCYGEVFPCFAFYEMKKSWGNIKEKGLKAFWDSYDLKIKREKIKACRECYWNCQVETNLLYRPFV
ncbi:MAG: radical SAM protein [Oligoflexia bacterium]|nr:radical SAM protein [Oligoflexia bacterium]